MEALLPILEPYDFDAEAVRLLVEGSADAARAFFYECGGCSWGRFTIV